MGRYHNELEIDKKIIANNQLFSEIVTSSRWQEENNRLLFSITGIDDQEHSKLKL